MNMTQKQAQVLVIVAVFLMVVLLLLALSVETGRISQERHHLRGVADAAAKAGMFVVADQMVTLAAAQQTQAALNPCLPDAGYGTPGASCTATPPPEIVFAWLNDDDRATLVGPSMRTQVAQAVRAHIGRNGYGPGDLEVQVQYPYRYHPTDTKIRLFLRLKKQIQGLLASLLGWNKDLSLSTETQQELPQRWEP